MRTDLTFAALASVLVAAGLCTGTARAAEVIGELRNVDVFTGIVDVAGQKVMIGRDEAAGLASATLIARGAGITLAVRGSLSEDGHMLFAEKYTASVVPAHSLPDSSGAPAKGGDLGTVLLIASVNGTGIAGVNGTGLAGVNGTGVAGVNGTGVAGVNGTGNQ